MSRNNFFGTDPVVARLIRSACFIKESIPLMPTIEAQQRLNHIQVKHMHDMEMRMHQRAYDCLRTLDETGLYELSPEDKIRLDQVAGEADWINRLIVALDILLDNTRHANNERVRYFEKVLRKDAEGPFRLEETEAPFPITPIYLTPKMRCVFGPPENRGSPSRPDSLWSGERIHRRRKKRMKKVTWKTKKLKWHNLSWY